MNPEIGMLLVFLSLINLVTALRISSLSQYHLKSDPSVRRPLLSKEKPLDGETDHQNPSQNEALLDVQDDFENLQWRNNQLGIEIAQAEQRRDQVNDHVNQEKKEILEEIKLLSSKLEMERDRVDKSTKRRIDKGRKHLLDASNKLEIDIAVNKLIDLP
eukprot:Platyproteum_vivax@DN7389_c1_g4_i2.p1